MQRTKAAIFNVYMINKHTIVCDAIQPNYIHDVIGTHTFDSIAAFLEWACDKYNLKPEYFNCHL